MTILIKRVAPRSMNGAKKTIYRGASFGMDFHSNQCYGNDSWLFMFILLE